MLASRQSLKRSVVSARGFEEEPDALLGLIDPILDQARGRNVTIVVAKRMARSQTVRQSRVVIAELGQHVLWHGAQDIVFEAI